MKYIRYLVHTVIVILGALIILSFIIEDDAWLKDKVEKAIITGFSSAGQCQFSTHVTSINLLGSSVHLGKTSAKSCENIPAWQWQASEVTIHFSWLELLWHKKIRGDVSLTKLKATSTYQDGSLAIARHIQALTAQGQETVPFDLRKLSLERGTFTIAQEKNKLELTFSLTLKPHSRGTALASTVHTGCFTWQEVALCTQLQAQLSGTLSNKGHDLKLHGSCTLPCAINAVFEGTYAQGQGYFKITDTKKNISATLQSDIHTNSIKAQAQLPLAPVAALAHPAYAQSISGQLMVHADASLTHILRSMKAELTVDKASYQGIPLPNMDITITSFGNKPQGTLTNCTALALPGSYTVAPRQLQATINVDEKELQLTYRCILNRHHTQKRMEGVCSLTKEHLIVQGTGNDLSSKERKTFSYDFLARSDPVWHLEYLDCHSDDTLVISLKAKNHETFQGTLDYALIQLLLREAGFAVPGQGMAHITGTISKQMVDLKLSMKGGTIRLANTYNLLTDVQGRIQYDLLSKQLTISELMLGLYKGTITASEITALLDEQYQLSYLHAPLMLRNCFLSKKKELFALFSGALTFDYHRNKQAKISGFIILDRSHIHSNIFSDEFKKQLFGTTAAPFSSYGADIEFDVGVTTQSPIQVKTPFLEGAARLDMRLGGSLVQPLINGHIEITNGSFIFPYKPLFIKRGRIYFMPQQDDPVIDILAQNSIKQYVVRMTVQGSAKSPRLRFDATPTLTEEQIIGLLLGGSEDGSLYLAMPTSVMSSIENLLFGPARQSSQFQRTLQSFFKPLKNLRIVPRLSDQAGRGGLKGSLTVEVNDRLRAIIEQNFSLTEDVLIEVEYDLSDEARLRAFRDQRGDLGGEIEGRWKF